jgi:hypothetical protein
LKTTFNGAPAAAHVDAVSSVESTGMQELERVDEERSKAVSATKTSTNSQRKNGLKKMRGDSYSNRRQKLWQLSGKDINNAVGEEHLNENRLALMVRGSMVTSSCSTLTHST